MGWDGERRGGEGRKRKGGVEKRSELEGDETLRRYCESFTAYFC